MKGLLVHTLRTVGADTTNGGATATKDRFVLIDPDAEKPIGPFDAKLDAPALVVVRRSFAFGDYIHAEVADKDGKPIKKPGMAGPMFGGNFVTTSDSRFPNKYPIPVHDRFEGDDKGGN